MEGLPNILIRKTALSLPFTKIIDLCRTNKKFNRAICHYQQFWYDKLVLDYNVTQKYSEELDWKRIYIHYFYRLIGLGSNEFGQLGLGLSIKTNELTEIPTIAVMGVACGFRHTVIVDVVGNLWGTGSNYSRQLGINTGSQDVRNFVKLTRNLKFIQVACGSGHTLALSSDNRIWVTGSNFFGELGLGSIDRVNHFIELKGYRAKQIACGDEHSAFIDLDGNLYTFGSEYYGQVGRGGNHELPGKVLIDIPIIQFACGTFHTVCIDGNNEIWVFGNNRDGQLGNGISLEKRYPEKISVHKAKFVSCGSFHTAFIDFEDHVWIFGSNIKNQLGLSLQGFETQYIPTKITQVYSEGRIINRDFRVKHVYCGDDITLFIDFENNLWVTGRNEMLNIESKVPAMIPRIKASKVAAGFRHMVIIGYYN